MVVILKKIKDIFSKKQPVNKTYFYRRPNTDYISSEKYHKSLTNPPIKRHQFIIRVVDSVSGKVFIFDSTIDSDLPKHLYYGIDNEQIFKKTELKYLMNNFTGLYQIYQYNDFFDAMLIQEEHRYINSELHCETGPGVIRFKWDRDIGPPCIHLNFTYFLNNRNFKSYSSLVNLDVFLPNVTEYKFKPFTEYNVEFIEEVRNFRIKDRQNKIININIFL